MARKSQLIGVDLGSYSVKVAEVESSKNGMILKNFGIALLPPDAIMEGQIQNKVAVSETLKNLFAQLNIKNNNVCTGVSGVSGILKKLPTFQSKTIEQIEESLKVDVEQYIPYDISEVYLDHYVLIQDGSTPKPGTPIPEADVILAAAPKALVDLYVEVFEAAELNPVVMDIGMLAIQNAIEATVPELPEAYLVANIGADCLSIHAVKKNAQVFTRDTPLGGDQLTRAIMTNLNLEYWEAEEVKLGHKKVAAEKEQLVKNLFVEYVTEWTKEVSKAVEYLRSNHPELGINKLYLVGGSSLMPGLKDCIAFETRLNVEGVNPFPGLIIDNRRFDEQYLAYHGPASVQVIGLALRQAGDK